MKTRIGRTGARRTWQSCRLSPRVGAVSAARRTRSRRERAKPAPLRIAHSLRRGFTLIETLLALALCGLLMSAVFSAIYLQERTRAAGERQVAKALFTWGIVEDVTSDLRSATGSLSTGVGAVPLPTNSLGAINSFRGPAIGEKMLDVRERLLDINLPPRVEPIGLIGEPNVLVVQTSGANSRFSDHSTVRVPASNQPVSRLVAYFVHDGRPQMVALGRQNGIPQLTSWQTSAKTRGLVRIERTPWFFGGQRWSSQTLQDEPLHLISPQVRAIRFRYLDGRDWKERWDSVAQHTLPTAVEVSLTWVLTDGNESSPLELAEEIRRFVIRLPQAS